MMTSQTIPVETLTLNRISYPHYRIAWELSRAQNVTHTIKYTLSVHRIVKKCLSSTAWWYCYCRNYICVRWLSVNRCRHRDYRWEGNLSWLSTSRTFVGLASFIARSGFSFFIVSFHKYNYGIFIGRCPYSPCATWIRKCRRCPQFLSREIRAPIVQTYNRPDGVDLISAYSRAEVLSRLHRHQGLRACRSVRRVQYIFIQLQQSADVHCAFWVNLRTLLIVLTNDADETCITPLTGDA